MPVSIHVSDLSWSTPDGCAILSHLDLSFTAERTGLVGRNGTGKTTLLKLISGDLVPLSGRVSVTGTLGVLRQSVQAGGTTGDLFGVTAALAILRRAEAGAATLDDFANADWSLEERLVTALGQLGLDAAPDTPLEGLSGGQRTRAALAALVFAGPDFLLLDEPTNHLDIDAIEAVEAGLRAYDGALMVVSHDEAFLTAIGIARRLEL